MDSDYSATALGGAGRPASPEPLSRKAFVSMLKGLHACLLVLVQTGDLWLPRLPAPGTGSDSMFITGGMLQGVQSARGLG